MQVQTKHGFRRLVSGLLTIGLAVGAGLYIAGCENSPPNPAPHTASSPIPPSDIQVAGQPGQGQSLFDTDDQAVKAIVAAAKAQNHDQMHQILGPAWKELLSGDKVQDAASFKEFSDHVAEHSRIEKRDDSTSLLYIGKEDWPFPIPVVRLPDGKWFFDTEAGKTEILDRRIGANEIEAIRICHEYVAAQRQYAATDHDGSGLLKYAQHIVSTPGKMDGLYWKVDPGQEESPFGPLLAQAESEGYQQTSGKPHEPYHGYHFRILKQQGPAAPGGKYSYVINGNMIAGFALVAFPADYDQSGIMTFIVNHQGKIFQKDLGIDTREIARKMVEYNPDSTWTPVKE